MFEQVTCVVFWVLLIGTSLGLWIGHEINELNRRNNIIDACMKKAFPTRELMQDAIWTEQNRRLNHVLEVAEASGISPELLTYYSIYYKWGKFESKDS